MSLGKNLKIIVLLIGLAVQGVVYNMGQTEIEQWSSQLTDRDCNNVVLQIAGEVPELGSILLLAFGSLWLRKENHKNKRKIRY